MKCKNIKGIRKYLKLLIESLIKSCIIVFSAITIILFISAYNIKNDNKYDKINNLFIEDNERWYNKLRAIGYIERLPDNQLNDLIDSGYKIIIDTEKLLKAHKNYMSGTKYENINAGGITIHKDKLIILKDTFNSIGVHALHEIGHAMDKIHCNSSNTEEFKDCFDNESDKVDKYYRNSCSEFYAFIYTVYYDKYHYLMYDISNFKQSKLYLESQEWW